MNNLKEQIYGFILASNSTGLTDGEAAEKMNIPMKEYLPARAELVREKRVFSKKLRQVNEYSWHIIWYAKEMKNDRTDQKKRRT